MKRYSLVVVTLSFIFGILLDGLLNIPFYQFIIFGIPLLLIYLFLFCRSNNSRNIACVAVIIISGLAYHHYRYYSYPASDIINFIPQERSLAKIRGVIVYPPVKKPIFNPWLFDVPQEDKIENYRLTFLVRVNNIWTEEGWQNVSGNVRVSVYSNELFRSSQKSELLELTLHTIKYGNSIEIVGNISVPGAPTNPGQFDYRKYLMRYEPPVRALMSVISMGNLQLLSRDHGNPIFSFVYSLKDKLRHTINTFKPQNEPSIISSLLLGERGNIPAHIMDNFIKTGTIPFLAISGLHVGILVVSIHFVFFVLGVNRKVSGSIIIIFIILYTILTGMKPPVLRAGVMVIVYYGSIILNRRWNTPSGIAAAALLILVRNPAELFSVSFQLSFLAMIGIILLSNRIESCLHSEPGLEERLSPNWKWNVSRIFKTYCVKTISVSLAAWLSVAPLVAHYFHIVAPMSILLNIIIFPFVWVILVSGFIFLIIGNLILPLAVPFAWIAFKSDYLMTKIISFFAIDHISFFYVAGPSVIWIVAYYSMGFIVINYKRLGLKVFHLGIIVLLICSVYVYSGLLNLKKDELRLTCMDVGHGSAIFFEFPNGKNLLFDAGTSGNYDIGRNVVAPFLWGAGTKKIDAIVISHQHQDHWSGLPSILQRFKVGAILTNKRFSDSEIGGRLLEMAQTKRIKTSLIGTNDEITGFGNARITVLNPPKDKLTISRLSVNDTSCVLKIECLGYSILSCADIGDDGIKMLLMDSGMDIIADIILVPHHGGDAANSDKLINRVKPRFAIVSAEKGQPSKKTMTAYNNSAKVLRTDRTGAITAVIDRNGIKVTGFNE